LLQDAGFEAPSIAEGSMAYGAVGSAWEFGNRAGIARRASSPGMFAAVGGAQVAFLQAGDSLGSAGSLSQRVTLPQQGRYQLLYYDAGGAGAGGAGGNLAYDIRLGDQMVATGVGTSSGEPFRAQWFEFVAAAGSYDLTFAVNASQPLGDTTAFFDRVELRLMVPEPGGLWLVLSGVAWRGVGRGRRRTTPGGGPWCVTRGDGLVGWSGARV
jgi:hypothetical protein